ncbi:MAG: hypothetical protein LUO89_16080 [Methanothrix sp.]|nr:hypothetical protein [Methanothrix sp.]
MMQKISKPALASDRLHCPLSYVKGAGQARSPNGRENNAKSHVRAIENPAQNWTHSVIAIVYIYPEDKTIIRGKGEICDKRFSLN